MIYQIIKTYQSIQITVIDTLGDKLWCISFQNIFIFLTSEFTA